jgi:hypothetical protein
MAPTGAAVRVLVSGGPAVRVLVSGGAAVRVLVSGGAAVRVLGRAPTTTPSPFAFRSFMARIIALLATD